ncbi:phosphotransferase family protein [Bacillus dakarensis]|uniref:phosphotransferase family protein n=1 Tax=Robertmurraya dakarensis TaxID=1926278 RepID=UPI0009822556|nr:phosphotransferase family protein [Bacillus dakarensis]
MSETTKQALKSYFESKLEGAVNLRISDFKQPSAGWSDEAFIFNVNWESDGETHQKGFAIRKQNKGGLMRENKNFYNQYNFLDILSKNCDLPVPGVHWYETDESILGGSFFVMDKLEGAAYVPWSKEGQQFLKQAHDDGHIPQQFVELLAKLHLLDYQEAGFTKDFTEPVGPYGYIDSKIKGLEEMYNRYLISPDPVMVDALEWLKANKPAAQRYSIVHNDYRTGNLLYKNNEITGILDWEAAEIGDPMADVAYVCAKSNRMDSPLLCYLLDRDMFYETYSKLTGLQVDEKVVHYYEVFHQVRFVLISQSAGTSFAKGQTQDLRMARQGYRWPLMRGMVAELLGY